MAGYYSGLLEGMLGRQQLQNEQTMNQERQQTIQINNRNLALQDQERKLMMQAFQGGSDARGGLEQAQDLQAQADKLSAVARKVMPINPKMGLDMLKESASIKQQKSQQDMRNMQIATQKNELLGTVAMTVSDQASLNEAADQLNRAGIPVPPKYKQWGPEAQQWWGTRARIAKRNLDSLKTDATVMRAQTGAEDEDRKAEQDRVKAQEADRNIELHRHGEYMKVDAALRKQFDAAQKAGEDTKAESYRRKIEGAKRTYGHQQVDIGQDPEAAKIKSKLASGDMTREEAVAALRELGYE